MNTEQIYSDDYDILYEKLSNQYFIPGDKIFGLNEIWTWTYEGCFIRYETVISYIQTNLKDNQSYWLISMKVCGNKYWYLVLQESRNEQI